MIFVFGCRGNNIMKVVINACYGGFGLSTGAFLKLIELDGETVQKFSFDEWGGKGWTPESTVFNKCTSVGDGFLVGFMESTLFKDGIVYTHNDGYSHNTSTRTDHDLIKVVEDMGDRASGKFSKLKIVDIPDDVDWHIEEYDGWESIHENHREWG